ncbi:MAG: nucleotidyltransferase domain-containing protein [Candidatus Aenigmatarchaeota archaeon]
MDENLKKIKEIILQTAKEMNIEIDKIILFGSRARGDYREDSDYDLLIVTKEKLEREKERKFKIEISLKVVNELECAIDIFVYSKEEFEKYKNTYGSLLGIANYYGKEI